MSVTLKVILSISCDNCDEVVEVFNSKNSCRQDLINISRTFEDLDARINSPGAIHLSNKEVVEEFKKVGIKSPKGWKFNYDSNHWATIFGAICPKCLSLRKRRKI